MESHKIMFQTTNQKMSQFHTISHCHRRWVPAPGRRSSPGPFGDPWDVNLAEVVAYAGWWFWAKPLWTMIRSESQLGLLYYSAITIPGWWYTYPSKKIWKSVGMMTFPTEWKVINAMFQTTNQYDMFISRLLVDFFWEMEMLRVGFHWYVLNFCSCESFYQKETLGMLTTSVSQPYKYVTLEYVKPHSHGNVVEIGQQGDLHPQIHSGMVRQFNQSHMEFRWIWGNGNLIYRHNMI